MGNKDSIQQRLQDYLQLNNDKNVTSMVMIGTKTLLRHMARKHMMIHVTGNSCADGVGVGVGVEVEVEVGVGGSVSHAAASGTISKTESSFHLK